METKTEKQSFTVTLPKWPALLVMGDRVTRDQAAQILIRTDSWNFSSNDREWDKMLLEAVGVKYNDKYPHFDYEEVEKLREECEELHLYYLVNEQVVSSWIGGPHGWCHWDGRIFANSFNIGKWPSVDSVLEEWQQIATAFPFLSLRSQLLSEEQGIVGDDGPGKPLVEFVVGKGNAEAMAPGKMLIDQDGESGLNYFARSYGSIYRERGCDIETYKKALEITKKALT